MPQVRTLIKPTYLKEITITDFKSIASETVQLHVPSSINPKPLENITLLLGKNGSGKTSILRSICLALLGEALPSSGYSPRYVVREAPGGPIEKSILQAVLTTPDASCSYQLITEVDRRRGVSAPPSEWSNDLLDENSPALFVVAYGSSRWVPVLNPRDTSSQRDLIRKRRYQRIASLFEDHYGLMPLEVTLSNPKTAPQIKPILDSLLEASGLNAKIVLEPIIGFQYNGIVLPLEALSDGFRSYISWLSDFLYHLSLVTPAGMALTDMSGIVLVDEIDLHLHASWQRTIATTISEIFPAFQFIFTTHSPLVANGFPTKHIRHVVTDEHHITTIRILEQNLLGLDADQTLLTPYFGLKTTRAPAFAAKIKELEGQAAQGNPTARLELLRILSEGIEE